MNFVTVSSNSTSRSTQKNLCCSSVAIVVFQSLIFPALWLVYMVFLLEVTSPPTALWHMHSIAWGVFFGSMWMEIVQKVWFQRHSCSCGQAPCRLVCHNFPLVSFPDRSTKKTWWIWGSIPSQIPASKWTVMGKKRTQLLSAGWQKWHLCSWQMHSSHAEQEVFRRM